MHQTTDNRCFFFFNHYYFFLFCCMIEAVFSNIIRFIPDMNVICSFVRQQTLCRQAGLWWNYPLINLHRRATGHGFLWTCSLDLPVATVCQGSGFFFPLLDVDAWLSPYFQHSQPPEYPSVRGNCINKSHFWAMFELQCACDTFLWVRDFRRKAGKDGCLKLSAKPIQTQVLKQTQNRKENVNFL